MPPVMSTSSLRLSSHILAISLIAAISVGITCAQVPASATFRHVNEGDFGDFVTEYGASYRATPLFEAPFQLMWHNTTPGQYYIGLRMGLTKSESLFRWVWDANRGRPVGEGATLSFGKEGNLVLAEANGKVVWSTGTANKGVVGIKILPTGNLVLYDKKGKFLWQSFSYPTDTLFIGQTLSINGPSKLVSRKSETENSEGRYSFVIEPTGPKLYVAASPKPMVYSNDRFTQTGGVTSLTFEAEPVNNGAAYELHLSSPGGGMALILARPKYNATLSFLRVAVDGNLEIYTYNDQVFNDAWERTFAFFSSGNGELPECNLPSKCGALGLCKKEMCVACPKANGLQAWSESCTPSAFCVKGKRGPGTFANYYKVVGVESFIPKYNEGLGKVTLDDCKTKCTADCSCPGIFYWEESSTCWVAPILGTLSVVPNTSHVAYLKTI